MSTLDLSTLPAPAVVEPLDFETLFAARKARLLELTPDDERTALADTLALESEPIVRLLQENAYRELVLRQRINEAAQAVMIAFASGPDLEQIAARCNVKRLTIQAADPEAVPPVEAVMESYAALRIRTLEAWDALSVAGPRAAYVAHARSADGRVADATAISPSAACVTVSVLSIEGDGTASVELLAIVRAALNDEEVRPVADRLTVQTATIAPYAISARLYLSPGPEAEPILAAAQTAAGAYATTQRRLGRDIRRTAIIAALHVAGVQHVELDTPAADIILDETSAGHCTGIQITLGGTDE